MNVKQYLESYHPALHLPRLVHLLFSLTKDSAATTTTTKADVLTVANHVIGLAVESGHTLLYRAVIEHLFEKGFEIYAQPELVATCQARAGSDEVDLSRRSESKSIAAVQVFRSAISAAIRGDAGRVSKLLSYARDEANESESLMIAVQRTTILTNVLLSFAASSLSTTNVWTPSAKEQTLSPLFATSYAAIQRLSDDVTTSGRKTPIGSPHAVSDEDFVFQVVAEALVEAGKCGEYGKTAYLVLKHLHRYPILSKLQVDTTAPHAVIAYNQQSSQYVLSLEKYVKDTQLLCLRDVVMMGVLSLFASSLTRSECAAYLSQGHVKGWLEEDAVLNAFVNAMQNNQYGAAIDHLNEILGSRVSRDWLLSAHVQPWRSKIVEKCLLQQSAPYTSLSLDMMAATLHMQRPELVAQLRALIESGRLPSRLDLVSGLLVELKDDASDEARLLDNMQQNVNEALNKLLMTSRANSMMLHKVVLQATAATSRGGSHGDLLLDDGPSDY